MQPRLHVISVLKQFGVQVFAEDDDYFELVDKFGDPVVLHLPDPVPPEMIVHLFRRFGEMHGFPITVLRAKPN